MIALGRGWLPALRVGRDTDGVGDHADFFVSHAGADRAWAEWVAWQLTDAGYTVELDVWDWAAGQNFVAAMSDALGRCDRVVALFSAAYFDRSRYTTEEWSLAVLHVPGTGEGRLVPVRVAEVAAAAMPAVLRPLLLCDCSVWTRMRRGVRYWMRCGGQVVPMVSRCSRDGVSREGCAGWGERARGCLAVCRVCGTSRPVIPGLPGGMDCCCRCGSGCWPGTRRWCRRSKAWAGW